MHIQKNIKKILKITNFRVWQKRDYHAANLAQTIIMVQKFFISDQNNNSGIKKLITNKGFKFF